MTEQILANGGLQYIPQNMENTGSLTADPPRETNAVYAASQTVASGESISAITLNANDILTVQNGGYAEKCTVNEKGHMIIESGGKTDNVEVNYAGTITISAGASATDILILHKNSKLIFTVAPATHVTGYYNFSSFEVKNGTLEDYKILSNCSIFVENGGIIRDITVSAGGTLVISSGGSAEDLDIADNAIFTMTAASGTTATGVRGGKTFSMQDGRISGYTVDLYGQMSISGGGIATDTNVTNNGFLYISSGGIATDTTLTKGTIEIYNGGIAENTVVSSGGRIILQQGGMLRGELMIHSGGNVTALQETVIDFSLEERKSTDTWLINDLSLINGYPSYSVTIADDQAAGTYKLARNASQLQSVTIGNGTVNYGTLTVNGGKYACAGNICSLQYTGKELTFLLQDTLTGLSGDGNSLSWEPVQTSDGYILNCSRDGFMTNCCIKTDTNSVNTYGTPADTYQWQVKITDGKFAAGNDIVSADSGVQQKYASAADGNMDLFFARADGVWSKDYAAGHQGFDGWTGTNEQVNLEGKNVIADVFEGSSDANILLLTDDTNGDALFVEDIYTSFGKDAARIAGIDEIRAGAGDDIIDMTSQQFDYVGDSIKIYGGLGNDTIWANKGSNTLFGDAGNDRIVGGSGDDVIIGGIGDDHMHGGGGNDTFCFGENWGIDTIEQLAGGTVKLCFANGVDANWNADTLTYSDGISSVTVTGITADKIEIVFESDSSLPEGVFLDAASEKIFEDMDKGLLA
ncbi:MAG: AIDA repeat-containing protein [Lentisphaeria bacterium]|nr:AIDA repeat-containing protein [Lentisphaeria bacterium]